MSTIGISSSSSSRPSSGVTGSVYLEPSSNKVIIKKADGSFKEISVESSKVSSSTNSALNYPGGLFSDMSKTYALQKGPFVHYDASNPAGTLKGVSYSAGDPVPVWGDCSGNSRHLDSLSSSAVPTLVSSDNSYAIENASSSRWNFDHGANDLSTVFFIQSTKTSYATLFGYYSAFMATPSSGQNSIFSHNFGSGTTPLNTDADGPSLRLGLRQSSFTKANTIYQWDCSQGGAADTASSITFTTIEQRTMTLPHSYHNKTFEVIVFNYELSIADINVVFNYLKNKYDGSGSITSSVPALTL